MPDFRYALVNRSPGIGCVPRGLAFTVEPRPEAGKPHHTWARHGILVSDRELTGDELRSFELAPLVDGDALQVMAAKIASGRMGDYPVEYVEAHNDDPETFRRGVLDSVGKVEHGVSQSIGDEEALVAAVLRHLSDAAAVTAGRRRPCP